MDRARASEARGREFESPQPHHPDSTSARRRVFAAEANEDTSANSQIILMVVHPVGETRVVVIRLDQADRKYVRELKIDAATRGRKSI
jgi:hypothetical protein